MRNTYRTLLVAGIIILIGQMAYAQEGELKLTLPEFGEYRQYHYVDEPGFRNLTQLERNAQHLAEINAAQSNALDSCLSLKSTCCELADVYREQRDAERAAHDVTRSALDAALNRESSGLERQADMQAAIMQIQRQRRLIIAGVVISGLSVAILSVYWSTR